MAALIKLTFCLETNRFRKREKVCVLVDKRKDLNRAAADAELLKCIDMPERDHSKAAEHLFGI